MIKLGKDNNYFEKGKFVAKRLADEIINKYNIITMDDTEEVLYYENGVYKPNGEMKIKQEVENILDEAASKTRVSEVDGHIKRSTYISRNELNKPLNLINLKNGIYDFNQNKLYEHSPKYFFTIQTPVKYDPDSICPKFLEFIGQVLPEEFHDLIQELFGYLLWRDYEFQYAFIFHGEGRNGKSTLINTGISFIGEENISHIALQDMSNNRFASSELYGKSANIYADLPDRELEDSSLFKQLTGGDRIKAERKFKNPFYFINYAKLLFSANKIPETYDNTPAFFRRWIIIKFPYVFSGEKEKTGIIKELTTEEELNGIFNWAIEGLKRLHKNKKFSYHLTLKEVMDYYIKESNPIQMFVKTLLVAEHESWTSKSKLYEAYVFFCKENNYKIEEENVFGRKIKPLIYSLSPFISEGRHGYTNGWKGLKIGS